MAYEIEQSHKKDPKKESYWNWSIWIKAPKEEMQKIDKVVYILHPTFTNRVRETKSIKTKFKLKSSGWGEFTIYIQIYFKEGQDPLYLTHDLKLFSIPEEKKKKIFISSNLSDKKEVEQLVKELDTSKVEITSADDSVSGSNFSNNTFDALEDSDALVLYGKDLSISQNHEIGLASDMNKDIYIVGEFEKGIISDDKNIQLLNSTDDLINMLK